jgi:hypothetical protein
MSTEIDSIPATVYPIVNLDDPNRIITVQIKASDLWKTRKIIACLSNPSSITYDILLSVADESNHADMDYIHRVLYFAEMGWDFVTKEEAQRILGEK